MKLEKKYKTLFFDLDGTITNPKSGITKAVQFALEKFGRGAKNLDDLLCYIGPPLRWSFVEYGGLTQEEAETALVEYRSYYGEKGIFDATIYVGIPELLAELKACGYRLALATTKHQTYAEEILEHYNLRKYFDFVAGSDSTQNRNEKCEVLDYALKEMGISPNDALMIGDRLHDIEGAHICGMKCVAVMYGYGSLEEFNEYSADCIVKDVEELRSLLIN